MSLGYEMPNLLGTEVSDNQTIVIKHRSEDSTIPVGTRIITKIVKPLILFNGKMVQTTNSGYKAKCRRIEIYGKDKN